MKIARSILMLLFGLLMTLALNVDAQEDSSVQSGSAEAQTASAGAPSSSKAADRALRRRVLNALAKAKGLRASGITVRAHDGAVLIEGWVPEEAMIDQATQVAQSVPGVTSVKTTLTLSTL